MTDQVKERITTLRNDGYGYRKIANILDMSENTVKSFCRRNDLMGVIEPQNKQGKYCMQCGNPIVQMKGRKEKKFCSDKCRMAWWKIHPDKINKKAIYDFECAYCKKPFTAYGNRGRKYCSHSCYILDRFGGGGDE